LGNIYVATANGTYDGPGGEDDFGDSVLKLGWNGTVFGLQDFFTPYNQLYLQDNDLDLGSGGTLILPDQSGSYPHELIAGGKGGTLYLINRDDLGQYDPDEDNVLQSFPGFPFELTGVQSYWNGSVYVAGDHDYIKQYSLINGMMTPQPVSQSTVIFGGAGAASTSITANGNQNGILWALGHSNPILHAFDATNLSSQLYDSSQALHARDKLGLVTRFATPTVSDGRVYVAGKSALTVYGLLSSLSSLSGNNQSGTRGQPLPVPFVVLASDAYSQAPAAGVSVTCEDEKAGGQFVNGETQTTDATGSASFTYQLPRSLKVVTITCTNPSTSSTKFTETSTSGVPTALSIVSGNKQTAPPNTLLSKPFVVKVVDAAGLNVPGITVSFTDNGAGGSFSSNSVVTNSQGRASTEYTTGPNTGSVTVTASVTGLSPVNFTVTVK
jgi:hypothetical protein